MSRSKARPRLAPRSRKTPRVEILLAEEPARRLALHEAITQALAEEAVSWHVRVSATLVYASPSLGTWWWLVSLVPPQGKAHLFFVSPEFQEPGHVQGLVRKALRGERITIVCSSCGRTKLNEGLWHRGLWHGGPRPSATRSSHGICPDCAERLYPKQVGRIRERSRTPRKG